MKQWSVEGERRECERERERTQKEKERGIEREVRKRFTCRAQDRVEEHGGGQPADSGEFVNDRNRSARKREARQRSSARPMQSAATTGKPADWSVRSRSLGRSAVFGSLFVSVHEATGKRQTFPSVAVSTLLKNCTYAQVSYFFDKNRRYYVYVVRIA